MATGRVPVTSVPFVKLMRAVETAPAVAFKNPPMGPIVNPPAGMFNPPANVDVAVPVAVKEPTCKFRAWSPPLKVDVAVVVPTVSFSMREEDAMSAYVVAPVDPVSKSPVEVAETD